jgi:hypothetical protein
MNIEIELAAGRKCRRCWRILQEVGSLNPADLCMRCAEAAETRPAVSSGCVVPFAGTPWETAGPMLTRVVKALDAAENVYAYDWSLPEIERRSTRYWAAVGIERGRAP